MIGAIVGDIAGSIYEFHNIKTHDLIRRLRLCKEVRSPPSPGSGNFAPMNRRFGERAAIGATAQFVK